jgi:hypothetical protein
MLGGEYKYLSIFLLTSALAAISKMDPFDFILFETWGIIL